MIRVCVIIPFRGNPQTLSWALDGFARQKLPRDIEVEARVGGDGCAPPTYEPANSTVTFRLSAFPRSGVSGTKNLLLKDATADILIFANADTRPVEGFVEAHVRRLMSLPERSMVLGSSPFERTANVAVFDALIEDAPMVFFYARMKPHEYYDYRHAWNLNVSVRFEDYVRAGGFSESLRPYGYEDLDFAFKVMGEEHRVYFDPAAEVLHRHPMTLDGYLDREETLGMVAPNLARVNSQVFKALFGGRELDQLVNDYRTWTTMDLSSHRWIYRRLCEWENTRRPERQALDTIYQLHVPLKRLAFRLGFLRGMELLDDARWLERTPRRLWKKAIEP